MNDLTFVQILADSVDNVGQRITTFKLRYPRIIHSELLTYRNCARNSASSRAIPFSKNIENIDNELFIAPEVRKNQKGMQGFERFDIKEYYDYVADVNELWLHTKRITKRMSRKNPHKQHINRYLEPFQYITVVFTITDPQIIFEQRLHPAAQPEFQTLAGMMKRKLEESKPEHLSAGEWHLPFILTEEFTSLPIEDLVLISAARCARVSYRNFGEKLIDVKKDLDLAHRLLTERPPHFSPFEHVCVCTNLSYYEYESDGEYIIMNKFGPHKGWKSLRWLFERNRNV